MNPRADRDGRDKDHRCAHGRPAGEAKGKAVWPCPDCHERDCQGCSPYKSAGARKKDKRGFCKEHGGRDPQ